MKNRNEKMQPQFSPGAVSSNLQLAPEMNKRLGD